MSGATVRVQLAYVAQGGVRLLPMQLTAGATLSDALLVAQSAGLVTAAEVERCAVAVFGRRRSPQERLHDGDRIELVGPLTADPKESRQRRVAHRRAASARDKWRGAR